MMNFRLGISVLGSVGISMLMDQLLMLCLIPDTRGYGVSVCKSEGTQSLESSLTLLTTGASN